MFFKESHLKKNACAFNNIIQNKKLHLGQEKQKKNNFFASLIDIYYEFLCQKNYYKILKKLKRDIKLRKLRVVFLSAENQKWGYQTLYDLFDKDEHFEPLVLVGVLRSIGKNPDKAKTVLEKNYQFFKSRDMNVDYMYKNNKYVDLKNFKPDIVFFEQPWGLSKHYKPQNISKYALCCYTPYSCSILEDTAAYVSKFHGRLFRYFVEHELNILRYEGYKKNNSKNCLAVGYPKLDVYLDKVNIDAKEYWKDSNKIKIIYAPHHSFENDKLNLATFRENGKMILELAQKHPETTWIFKPHPRFKYALIKNNIMTESEADEYYKDWEAVGKIYDQGDYFNIFKTADLMLTDCCSFLAEFLPTDKPLIRMMNQNGRMLNSFGQKLVQGYYLTYSNNELVKQFQDLVTNHNDYKKEERAKNVYEIIDFKEKSSHKIYEHLVQLLQEES